MSTKCTASTKRELGVQQRGLSSGPLLQTLVAQRPSFFGKLTYTTMPEQLQARNISWKIYTSPDQTLSSGLAIDTVDHVTSQG